MSATFRSAQRRVLLATMFCYLFFYTGRQTFGFAIPGIEAELGLSKTLLGWVSATLLWCYALGQVVNGDLGDGVGGRRMMSLGAVLSTVLNWWTSLAQGLAGLALPWGLNGFAQSMGWAPGSRVLANWFRGTERGRVYGWYTFAAGSSSVLAFATSTLILDLQLDWRWIFRLPVVLLLGAGIVYFLVVRDRPEERSFSPVELEPGIPRAERSRERYAAALTNGSFLTASVAIGFQNLARYGLLVWVPVHFLGADWRESGAKWIAVALPVGMAFGAVSNGYLSDHLFRGNRSRVIQIFLALAALSSFAMYGLSRESALGVPLLFLCGFFVYGPQASFWALCPDLLGRSRTGTGTGLMNAIAYVFAGLGEPLIGWSIESTGDRTELVFLIVGAASSVGALVSLAIRR
jgi:OPA family glycerol-3-phosphate transporter-like MFS transporter